MRESRCCSAGLCYGPFRWDCRSAFWRSRRRALTDAIGFGPFPKRSRLSADCAQRLRAFTWTCQTHFLRGRDPNGPVKVAPQSDEGLWGSASKPSIGGIDVFRVTISRGRSGAFPRAKPIHEGACVCRVRARELNRGKTSAVASIDEPFKLLSPPEEEPLFGARAFVRFR